MQFYRIDDQIVFSDNAIIIGEELIANTSDGTHEKHVLMIYVDSDTITIQVGTEIHPSLPAHYIEFILLETATGIHTKWLKPGDVPSATFHISADEKVIAAYEYCNLHGLWKAKV